MAKALGDGHLALAQIYGIRIPTRQLSEAQTRQLAHAAALIKANFNPDEPRDAHGRWTGDSGAGETPRRTETDATPRSNQETPTASGAQLATDNQRQNRMVRDIVVQLRLTKDKQQELHRVISGQGYSYREILDLAKEMFGK